MWKRRIQIILITVLVLFIFWPTFLWMKARFLEPESFYAHGFLVPFVFAYLIFQKREKLKKLEIKTEPLGLWIVFFSLLLHVFACYFEINFLSGFTFIFVLLGLVLFNAGILILREISFAFFFLIFMVPLPEAMTLVVSFKMKLFAAQIASFLVNVLFNIPLKNSGSLIYLPNGVLAVGNPCSGLKSLITLVALGLLFAYLSGFNLKRKILFFIFTVPVSILANIMRIMLLIIVFYVYGKEVAMGWFHDFSGFLLFLIAFLGLIFLRKIFLSAFAKNPV